VACHLRAQKIGIPGARILGIVPGTEVSLVEACSAVDGTWGMKAQHYEMGLKYSQRLSRAIENAKAKLVITDCPLAGRRIEKENATIPLHPMEALADAYGLSLDVKGSKLGKEGTP
jgi:glycerol-3-phosphate dehydrogenase subunit C